MKLVRAGIILLLLLVMLPTSATPFNATVASGYMLEVIGNV